MSLMRNTTLLLASASLALGFAGLNLAADSTGGPAPPVVADLRDGSKIFGKVIPSDLSLKLKTEEVGELRIPINKINKLEFSAEGTSATLFLQNGDRLKGEIQLRTLKLETLLGQLTVPLDAISKVQILVDETGTSQIMRAADWQPVPFPANCDWPGDRGLPSKVDEDGDIILQGQPLRSVHTYSLPLEIDCDFTLLDPLMYDGHLKIMVMPENTAAEMISVRGVELDIAPDPSLPKGSPVKVSATQFFGSLHNNRVFHAIGTSALSVGEPNRLKVEVGVESWKVTVNQQEFILEGIRAVYQEAFIQLWNWQPSSRWSVQHLSIRSTASLEEQTSRTHFKKHNSQ